ncbi:hypothetical protein BMH32_10735 [Leucobacter sp. OLJS4]|uniref:hypothetical protein n=1 Tax=unclassified Leucobacter TaxID=2621730 RepID=UPI000C1965B2|nr:MULTISPECIES: hypothetical protein [unclassified Leucobacter]PIJ08376.1 hypothetical protein BMH30_13995 [Leucobacter sp. OLES1]PII81701.1 hypothetical protein BMH25_14475 [Leucobacter sp. OLCALW19]PII86374.1 hypothetical protein BMH26_14910 [Leucobacter sp. OLTLW20]PII90269.1 hypothetical protein BMH27_13075 [Leucobacter sp. OLAS13]PII97302.1 hypothetical protein BMH29_13760 [Leucobacter sp. OLDS2]
MSYTSYIPALIAVVWLLVRQLSVRPLKDRPALALILLMIGAAQTAQFAQDTRIDGLDVALGLASLVVGTGLAAVRAHTVRLWRDGDAVLTQGTVWTLLLWIVGIGQHLVFEFFTHTRGFGTATLLVYFGVVLLVQRLLLSRRARLLHLTAPADSRRGAFGDEARA